MATTRAMDTTTSPSDPSTSTSSTTPASLNDTASSGVIGPAAASTSASASSSALNTDLPPPLKASRTAADASAATTATTAATAPAVSGGKSRSCDVCRRRKIRCIKAPERTKCEHCTSNDIDCTFHYVPKRPGPRSHVVEHARLARQQQSPLLSSHQPLRTPPTSSGHHYNYSTSSADASTNLTFMGASGMPSERRSSDSWTDPPPDSAHSDWNYSFDFSPPVQEGWQASPALSVAPLHSAQSQSVYNSHSVDPLAMAGLALTHPEPPPPTAPPSRPPPQLIHPPSCLDDVAPRQLFAEIFIAYERHLYILVPFVHRPTFRQDLAARRDERDPIFLAFCLSLAAYTLAQLPRCILQDAVACSEDFHAKCHQGSKALQPRMYEPLTLLHIATLYIDHMYLANLGRYHAAAGILAEATRLAFALGIHDDRYSVGCDAIEQELRRRAFYVLYGTDRTLGVLEGCPLLINDVDCSVSLPTAVDDEYLTEQGAFPNSTMATPLLVGFRHLSRLYQLNSDILTAHRHDLRNPPPRTDLVTRLEYIQQNRRRLIEFAKELPVSSGPDTLSVIPIETAFDIMRANSVCQVLILRFALHEWETFILNRVVAAGLANKVQAAGLRQSTPDDLAAETLGALQSLTHVSMACNGIAFLDKVIYVNTCLLNKLTRQSAGFPHLVKLIEILGELRRERPCKQDPTFLLDTTSPSAKGTAPAVPTPVPTSR